MKSILLREPCFKENIECDIQKKVLHEEFSQWIPSAVDIDMWQVCRLVFFLIKSLLLLILFIIVIFCYFSCFVKWVFLKQTPRPRRNKLIPLYLDKEKMYITLYIFCLDLMAVAEYAIIRRMR